MLPRATDAVADSMACLAKHAELEWMVLDFSNAFFIMPLHPRERKHFVISHRGTFYVFIVLTQGARGSPLTWGRLAALVTRLTQSMFEHGEAHLQTYVDDPIMVSSGSPAVRSLSFAVAILAWRCLKFPLAFSKGQRGTKVNWIGCTFELQGAAVVASIKAETLKALEALVDELLSANVVKTKTVASLAGSGSHIATLIWAWRPFLQHLWAAIYQTDSHGAPANCIWTKQIKTSLLWMKAFLSGSCGTVSRTFFLDKFLGQQDQHSLLLDASPFGLGGVLLLGATPVAWFSDAISATDIARFGYDIGSSAGQQCWECLAALAALRCWSKHWKHGKSKLVVTGDSVAMLTLVIKMKPPAHSAPLGLIARELALDNADAIYEPDVVSHTPGVANVTPDILSRQFDPKYAKHWVLPAALQGVPESKLPPRDDSYFRTLRVPGG